MGAVERYAHPKVWSPAGGWWCNPPNWQRNTMKLAGAWIIPAMFVFAISVSKEVHTRAAPIPCGEQGSGHCRWRPGLETRHS